MTRESEPASRDAARPLGRSEELLERARQVIPGGSQSNSRSPQRWIQGVTPSHLEAGDGSRVRDVDGNEYLDLVSSGGPLILGHDYPDVSEAVRDQLSDGSLFTLPHPLQVEVAEQFVDLVPSAEAVQFAKNGNDVTTLAAKLARAHTGRDVIATTGYHGWPDVWTAATKRDRGVPDAVGELTIPFQYGDVEGLERIFTAYPDEIAAVVMTPVQLGHSEDGFLERVRELTRREDALLVFDEVVTGFRFGTGGAQAHFDVTPDLACFAKAMANGYPISAIAGRRDLMALLEADDFFFTMTYADEAVSLAATHATLSVLDDEPVFEHIFQQGEKLREGYNELAADHGVADHTGCQGYPPYLQVNFGDANGEPGVLLKSLFLQECIERGVLMEGVIFPNYSHTDEDVDRALEVFDAALAEVAAAIEQRDAGRRLDGEPIGASVRELTDQAE